MKIVKLCEVTMNITDGKHGDCEPSENSGFYFISCKDVKDGQIDYGNARQITESSFNEANLRTQLEPNDILLTNSGTIGRMALIKDEPRTQRTTFQKSVAIIKPDTDKVVPSYLYYQLQNCVTEFINRSNGSAQKNLLLSTMRAFELHIHEDFGAQNRLANVLSAYDNLIENNQKQIKLLEEAAQRLYQEWFVKLRFPGHENVKIVDGVPEGWKRCVLDDVILFNPKVSVAKGTTKKSVPMSALSASSMIVDSPQFTLTKTNAGSKFENGDTLLARITPCLQNGKIGYVNILEPNEAAVGSTEFIVMRSKTLNPFIVYLLARSEDFRDFAIKTMTGSDGRQRAQVNKLMGYPYLLAPKRIIDCFGKYSAPIFDAIREKHLQNINLAEARDRLLPKLMSGELEV